MKVLAFGDIVWDVYPDKQCLGGAPLNFAAHLAALGEEAYILSAVGQDALGEKTLRQVQQWNVSTAYLHISEHLPTGTCTVRLNELGIPSYEHGQNTAYDFIPCDSLQIDFDVLYFGTLALRSEQNFRSLQRILQTRRFEEVFVDLNLRAPFYDETSVRFAVEHASLLKISDEEMANTATLLEMEQTTDPAAFAHALHARYSGLKCVIITCGAEGAYALDCTCGREYTCAAQQVEVASTVGAGDSFSAAFLHKFRQGQCISECLQFACRVAAFVVSRYDAVPQYSADIFQ